MIETKLDGKTPDIAEENIKKLKAIFPDVFEEGKIDFEKLQQVLGEYVDDSTERYNFSWNGKSRALQIAQTPSLGTLRPCKEESKDWDTTENLYIEGDNLEVLKLLQKTYHNKIKMIYIDPPYNTGHDFVYKDDFKDNIQNYLETTGQVDGEGNKITSNSESNGRYHTDWLNMMYPRLRLARNLLSDDGVIFISIDDNEQSNLKKLCDEIFGEENFVAEFIWKCRNSLQHDEPLVSKQTERILFYVKTKNIWNTANGVELNRIRKPFDATEYKNPDNDPRGPWLSSGKTRNDGRASYTVVSPTGVKFTKPWIPSPTEFKRWEEEGLIWWGKDGNSIPRKKSFLKDFKGNAISDILIDEYTDEIISENKLKRIKRWEIGTTESGTKREKELFDGKAPFDYPKPWTLIKYFVTISTNTNDIILDFFSGSATTAHAVMQLNAEDGGNRKFICVQLPEPTDEKSEAYKAGYKNICEIGKERIRRAGDKINAEITENNQQISIDSEEKSPVDIGFKVFKLDTSNIKKWQPDVEDDDMYSFIDSMVDNLEEGRSERELVYEIMLKYGIDLTFPIEELSCGDKKIYSIGFGMLMICVCDGATKDIADFIVKYKKENEIENMRVVFKDSSFKDDSAKTNVKEILKRGNVEEFITI